MSTRRVITDVPEENVAEIVESFESEGCSVTTEQQSDGKWTIKAECPEG